MKRLVAQTSEEKIKESKHIETKLKETGHKDLEDKVYQNALIKDKIGIIGVSIIKLKK